MDSLGADFGSGDITIDAVTAIHPHEDGYPHKDGYLRYVLTRIVDLKIGHSMEFGVFKGRTINIFSSLRPRRIFWGFDTFTGLPQPWLINKKKSFPEGTFNLDGVMPVVNPNVVLVKGLFEDTLPVWNNLIHGNVGFIHIDCDLYASALTVLMQLNHRIVPGTTIVFDELFSWHKEVNGYDNWRDGEWRALTEWLASCGRRVEPVARHTDESATFVVRK